LDARIAEEFPDYAELSNPKPLPAEAAFALLASDEALLVYLTTDGATWVWVLRRDHLTFFRVDIGAKELAGEVRALRSRLDPEFNPDLAPFPAARAYALYQKLIGPAEPLLAGVRHMVIVPDGDLQSLPFGVLVTRSPEHDPETPTDHRDIAWLARDYAVTVLPTVSSLRGLRQFANAGEAAAPFLGIGNPVLKGSPSGRKPTLANLFRGALADVEAVRELVPLSRSARGGPLGQEPLEMRLGVSVSAPFVWRCLSGSAIAPFPHPSHRTQRADFPHCALGQDFTPSPTARRAQSPGPSPLVASVLNQGPYPPPALPGFIGSTSLSATPVRPACPSRASG
jgi:hypothetical protein